MGQYEITVTTEYRYIVDANNEHEATNIYLNDNDSCIPTQHTYLNIRVFKVKSDD